MKLEKKDQNKFETGRTIEIIKNRSWSSRKEKKKRKNEKHKVGVFFKQSR